MVALKCKKIAQLLKYIVRVTFCASLLQAAGALISCKDVFHQAISEKRRNACTVRRHKSEMKISLRYRQDHARNEM